MNKPAWLFGVSTLLLGTFCLYLLMQPAREASALHDAALQGELSQLRSERDRLEMDVRSLRAAQARPAFPPPPIAAAPVSTAPAPTATLPIIKPDYSPTGRRTMVRLRNGKMFKQLGLSETQVSSLLDVLVAQEERATTAKPNEQPLDRDEVRAKNRAEVAAVIGSEAAEKLEAWQEQFTARLEVRRVRDQLDGVGEPLSEAQLSRITELIHARPPQLPPMRQQDESNEAFAARWKSWRTDNREQVRAELSTVLEPRQLERYDELDEMSRSFDKGMSFAMPPLAGRAAPLLR